MPTHWLDWSEDQVNTLLTMRRSGHSARQIGRRLGATRNAVIGKLHRLGESAPASPERYRLNGKLGGLADKTREKPKKERADFLRRFFNFIKTPQELKAPGTFPAEQPMPVASVPVKLLDLKHDHCRWPVGDPKDPGFHFCGAPCEPHLSYCLAHYVASVNAWWKQEG